MITSDFKLVHHIAIICSDYQQSKKFYTEVLGFSVVHEEYRKERDSYKLDLAINNETQIELFSFPNPPKRVTSPEACGLRHLAFHVHNIDEVVSYLQSRDIEVEEIRTDPITQRRFTFLRDPDNLPLELVEI